MNAGRNSGVCALHRYGLHPSCHNGINVGGRDSIWPLASSPSPAPMSARRRHWGCFQVTKTASDEYVSGRALRNILR